MASELPGDTAALNDDEAEDDEGDETGAPTTALAPNAEVSVSAETTAALKAMDNLTDVAEHIQLQKEQSPSAPSQRPLAPASSTPYPAAASSSGAQDITNEEIDALLPPAPVDLPQPAADGPGLADISREQLRKDSATFENASESMIAPDGIMPNDNGMEYVIGDP